MNKLNSMRNLEIPLAELYTYISQAEKLNNKISSVNIGWHIEHTLLVIQKISESVITSDEDMYKWKFNMPRLLVFQLSMFPPEKTSFVTVICSDGFRNHLMKCEPMKPMKQQLTFKKKPKRVQQNGRRETRWPSPGLQKMAWGSYLNHLCHF